MKTVTMYEAEDGKQFRDEAQCLEYEQQCEDARAANDMLENGATLMAALTRANQTRPWWDSGLTLEDKVILMKTTKATGFVVRHWQCSEKPGYKVWQIDTYGRLYLFGDSGSWSGTYGNWVSLQDLLRYAHQTAAQDA
jgi:hypothetical protein